MDIISQTIALGSSGATEDDYWIFTIEDDQYYDGANGVSVDPNDNVYSTLLRREIPEKGSTGYGYPTVVKLDSSGVLQWGRTLYHSGSGAEDSKAGIAHANSSGTVYLASKRAGSVFENAIWNSSGTFQSVKDSDANTERVYDCSCDSSGNYIAVGADVSNGQAGFIYKIASNNTVTWERGFKTTSPNTRGTKFYGVDTDSSDNVYVSGKTKISGPYDAFLVAKISSSGSTTWQTTFLENTANNDYLGRDVAVDSSGNVFAVGIAPGSESILVKYNSSGTMQWARKTDNGDIAMINVVADGDGNVYTCGRDSRSPYHLLIMKFNSSGTQQWVRNLGPSGTNVRNQSYLDSIMDIDSDGNLYIQALLGGYQMIVAKLPNDGSLTGTYSFSSNVTTPDIVYASQTATMSSLDVENDITHTVPTSSQLSNYDLNLSHLNGDFSSATYTSARYDTETDIISD